MPIPTAPRPAVTLLLAVLACAGAARAQDHATDASTPDATAPDASDTDASPRDDFVRACATCHGEDGSGTGPTVLDRPARDFKSGGFSFGNTPDALFRTITYGIPGTPMPAFGEAYDEEQRMRLAAYVRTLGPPVEELDVSERVMVVTDRPRVARGILPPVTDTSPLHPRGLLIGTPEGLSFEYRIDDVRLLAVRQGGFVERTDWTGRGGTPLQPLGVPLLVHGGGDPLPPFRLFDPADVGAALASAGAPALDLSARLLTTTEGRAGVQLRYGLCAGATRVALVQERVHAARHPAGTGWERELLLDHSHGMDLAVLRLALDLLEPAQVLERVGDAARPTWIVSRLPDGRVHCLQVRVGKIVGDAVTAWEPAWRIDATAGALRLQLQVSPGDTTRVTLFTVLLPEWSEAARHALLDGTDAR